MSTISGVPAAAPSMVGLSGTGRLLATLKRWWVTYMTWRIQQAAIVPLGSSDRQLKDIGLSRSEILAALRSQAARDHAFLRCS